MKGKASNLIQTKDGKARIYALAKAKSTWAAPDKPEMDKNFRVRFSVCGESWEERATQYPVAQGITPDMKEWVKLKIAARAHLVREGEKEKLRAIFNPRRVVMLAEVVATYLANVSPTKRESAGKNAKRLEHIGCEMTGLSAEAVPMTDEVWSQQNLRGWVAMRQEYHRRGWIAENMKQMPADVMAARWAELREALRTRKLPGVDEDTECEGNTTIQTYLRCAKAVFAWNRKYLAGLELPALKEFLEFTEVLPAPEGHREIPLMVRERIMAGLPELRARELLQWVLFQLCYETGARPISIKRAVLADLWMVEGEEAERLRTDTAALWGLAPDAVSAIGGVLKLHPTKRGAPVWRALSVELVSVLREVATAESLMGARSASHAVKIHNGVNEWLREQGLDGTHGIYMLRHGDGQRLRNAGGQELAKAGLGHVTDTAMGRYSGERRVVPLLGGSAL